MIRPPSALCYHRILPDFSTAGDCVESYHHNRSILHTLAAFRTHLDALQKECVVVDAGLFLECRQGRRMSKPAVLLTFDDGYVDFKEVVLPELQSRGLPCVLFPTMAPVRQGYVPPADQVYALLSADCRGQQLLTPEQRASWVSGVLKKTMLAAAPDEQGRMIAALADSLALPQALPAPIHMTEADLLQLPHNVYFGAHGLYHHEFGSLTDVELSDELQRILAWISWLRPEQAHGVWLAYPNGKANRSARPGVVTDAVHRAGVDFAFVASADPSIPEDSNFKIPRLFSHDDVGRFKHIWQPAL